MIAARTRKEGEDETEGPADSFESKQEHIVRYKHQIDAVAARLMTPNAGLLFAV